MRVSRPHLHLHAHPWLTSRWASGVLAAAMAGLLLWTAHIIIDLARGAELVIKISHVGSQTTKRYTLHCRPVGGSLPNARAACDAMDAWQNYHSYSYYLGVFDKSCPQVPGTVVAKIDGEDVTTNYNPVHVKLNFACPMNSAQRGLWRTVIGLETTLPINARPSGFHTADWIRYSPYPELAILCALLVGIGVLILRNISIYRQGRAAHDRRTPPAIDA
jgi:hypothetical protein